MMVPRRPATNSVTLPRRAQQGSGDWPEYRHSACFAESSRAPTPAPPPRVAPFGTQVVLALVPPRVASIAGKVVYPKYAGLPDADVRDASIEVLKGSRVELAITANMPLALARAASSFRLGFFD